MKASMILSFVGLLATNSFATNLAALEAECGSLGVMKLTQEQMSNVPDVSQIRHCSEHPLGRAGPSIGEKDVTEVEARDAGLADLHARACWFGSQNHGCSRGYCWKICDAASTGHWCWTAANNGTGAWHTCKADTDCLTTEGCGVGNNCAACGCSC